MSDSEVGLRRFPGGTNGRQRRPVGDSEHTALKPRPGNERPDQVGASQLSSNAGITAERVRQIAEAMLRSGR